MGATWHSGPRGSATRGPRGAYTALHIYLLLRYSKMGFQPSIVWKGIQPIRSSGVINPTIPFLLFRVGLIHTAFIMQVTWRDEERRIKRAINQRMSIACAVDHRRINQSRAI